MNGPMAIFAWLLIGISAFTMGFLSIPVSYEMWQGDIKAGDRMPGDAFAPTLTGAITGVAIEAVFIAIGVAILYSISKKRK